MGFLAAAWTGYNGPGTKRYRGHRQDEPAMSPAWTFADIIAPVGEEAFFATYYDRQPLHIPGDPDKFADVMNWEVLNDLLNMTAAWTPETLMLVLDRAIVPPARYCRETVRGKGEAVRQPDADAVMALLRRGASLVANDIDSMTAQMRSVADALETALTGKVQSNLYCSWRQRQAFTSHFDTHDVFALHTEGEKVWRLYETRVPHPVRHERFTGISDAEHERRRGRIMREVRMTPGDLLYIPRGWYHDALAASGGTLHLTFGMTTLVGLDMVGALYDAALEQEAFRESLPRAAAGRETLRARFAELGARLQELATSEAFLDAFETAQAEYRVARGGFDLPIAAPDTHYRVTGPDFRVERTAGGARLSSPRGAVPVPPGLEEPVAWAIARGAFSRGALLDAFSALGAEAIDDMLRNLTQMHVIAPIADTPERRG